MNILAIDTAGNDCGILVRNNSTNKSIVLVNENVKKGYAECLPSLLESALAEVKLQIPEIDRIGVSIGPGSFAGIRVGLAFAKGLALVHKTPIVGLTTLQILAESTDDKIKNEPILALVDSKSDEYFVQVFSSNNDTKVSPQVNTTSQILDLISNNMTIVCAKGSRFLNQSEFEYAAKIFQITTEQKLETIGQLTTNAKEPFKNPEPVYLRAPDAKPQSGFSVARV